MPRNISRIFIVDDERVIAVTLAAILKQSGFEVEFFVDPLEAFHASVSHGTPDLLISDINMPGCSGVELAIKLRDQSPDCEVLLLSGQVASMANLLEKASSQGYDFACLQKPVHPNDLIRTILDLHTENSARP